MSIDWIYWHRLERSCFQLYLHHNCFHVFLDECPAKSHACITFNSLCTRWSKRSHSSGATKGCSRFTVCLRHTVNGQTDRKKQTHKHINTHTSALENARKHAHWHTFMFAWIQTYFKFHFIFQTIFVKFNQIWPISLDCQGDIDEKTQWQTHKHPRLYLQSLL